MVVSIVVGLEDVVTGLPAVPLVLTGAVALVAGWLLATSPFPGWLAGIAAALVGGEAALIYYGRLDGPLRQLAGALLRLVWGMGRWPLDGPPDSAPVVVRLGELATGAGQAIQQLGAWAVALARGEPLSDPRAVALAWHVVVGGLALWAAWAVRRHRRPLVGVAPAGALVAGVLGYGRGEPAILCLLLFCAMLLLGLIRYDAQLRRWQREGVDYSEDIAIDVGLAVVGLAIALATVALLAPSISVRQIARTAQELLGGPGEQAERVMESFGISARGGGPGPLDGWAESRLPREHLIGSGPELAEQVVMVIRTDPSPPALGQPLAWRGLTFDTYTGAGWASGPTERIAYRRGELAGDLPPFPHQVIDQEVRIAEETAGLLYAAGTPLTADEEFHMAWRTVPTPGTIPEGDLFGATIRATSYRVESWIPTPTEAQLEAAGEEIPDWVRDRYLALPPSLPGRVVTLTNQLTAGATTPYERAIAIEGYLRTLKYTLDLPAPPAGQDVADHFLFDLRRGYCDYFATSMVVLARAAGLPARLVVGYASGTYDNESARMVVTEADAHSWPEVYFAGYGWIAFEPTAGRPAWARPEEAPRPAIPEEWGAIREGRGFSGLVRTAKRWWWVSLLLPLLAVGGWEVVDRWRLKRLPPAAAVAALHRRVVQGGRLLRVHAGAGDTPDELAASLGVRMDALAEGRRWGGATAGVGESVRWLTGLYVRTVYSPHAPDRATQRRAIEEWRRLRWRVWLGWLWQWRHGPADGSRQPLRTSRNRDRCESGGRGEEKQ
jgi:transglutaminase-like putative cysteine protease